MEAAISVEGLTKRYGQHTAVDAVSFSVARGEAFGILGPNGAGKTTTLEMIEGLREPDAGEITVLGDPVWPNPERIQGRIGVQLQSTSLFDRLSATELLELFARFYGRTDAIARAASALQLVGLEAKAGDYAQRLSGGQQQRLAIALALVHDPEVVFLDEPTTGLDPQARRNLWEVIRAINEDRGKTVVLTTHYLEEAEELCDRVAIMDEARIVALDTPAGLIAALGADARVSAPGRGPRRRPDDREPVGARSQPRGRVPAPDRTRVQGMSSRFWHTTVAQLKMTFRNRVALFWSLAFPIIFMSLLGLLFGRSVDAGTITVVDRAHVAQSQAVVRALEGIDSLTVKVESDPAHAEKQVHDGDRDGALVLTGGSGAVAAHLYTSNTNATQAGIIRGIVAGVTNRIGNPTPAVVFRSSTVDSSSLRYVDFLLPGIIAIAIMTSSVFGLSTILVDWRKRGILRRLKLTPMPLWEFLGSRVAASLALTVLQVVVLLIFGRIAFGIHISDQAWAAIPVALVGCLAFLAFGFFVGSIVGSPETADAVANSVTTPMMFLSGTFFPINSLPTAVATLAKVMPLYYLATGLRDSAVRGLSFTHVAPAIGVLCAMTVVLAAISLRAFRWEPAT